ncbi:hypothetical protein LAZ67_1007737 [Cordylochernes scorpioides]|uniref:Uncharacterized protein n=1 Tax=Cordylochernes scorpioides TaxID=51811 RepID=A0ABY6JZQ5_9ARAC|nr:hypothetical protein LAZ67_1007737 [Cordylochernes scorpioides]
MTKCRRRRTTGYEDRTRLGTTVVSKNCYNGIKNVWTEMAWIFGGSGLEDDALSILASAKLRIYRHFVQVGLGEAVEDPLIAWSRTLQRRGFLPSSPIIILPLIIEAFSVLGRPPDLRAWIFGSGLEDNDLAILVSAKSIIYRYFVQVGLTGGPAHRLGKRAHSPGHIPRMIIYILVLFPFLMIFQGLISTLQLVEKLDRYPFRKKRKIDSVEQEEKTMNIKKEATTQVGSFFCPTST